MDLKDLPSPSNVGEMYLRKILIELRGIRDDLKAQVPLTTSNDPDFVHVKETAPKSAKGDRK